MCQGMFYASQNSMVDVEQLLIIKLSSESDRLYIYIYI